MAETLARVPKPNRATHGGKGVFSFHAEADFTLDGATRALAVLTHCQADTRNDLDRDSQVG
jgi:hypothetical protein